MYDVKERRNSWGDPGNINNQTALKATQFPNYLTLRPTIVASRYEQPFNATSMMIMCSRHANLCVHLGECGSQWAVIMNKKGILF